MTHPPMQAVYRPARLTLLQAAPGRHEYDCVFVQPGRVLQADGRESDWLLPADVLRDAAPQFSGLSCYLDHPEQFGFGMRQQPRVANLAGVTFNARWEEAWPGQGAIAGGIRLYDRDSGSPGAFIGALMDQMLEDMAAGREVPPIGLSAVFWHQSHLDEETGLRITERIGKAESVDFVYSAGARGYVRAALERVRGAGASPPLQGLDVSRYWDFGAVGAPAQEATMSEQFARGPTEREADRARTGDGVETQQEQQAGDPADRGSVVDAMVAEFDRRVAALEARLGEQARGIGELARAGRPSPRLPETAGAPLPPLEDGRSRERGASAAVEAQVARLSTAVDRITALLATREELNTVQGMGNPPRTRISVGPGSLDQVQLAVEAMINGVRPPEGIRPLTGIRELYHLLSGDYEMTGRFQEDRVYLANVTTSTMAGLVANALNKVVVNEFMTYPQWWGPAVTTMDFTSLQDVRWITLGGVGELPTVAEGAAYTELTWDDQTETDSFVKKGGYLGLTLEAIDKDDTGRIRAAPRALAQAAWLTLGTSISDIFTSNSDTGPTMADTGALFNATAVSSSGGHANLLTTALSISAWRAVKLAMMKQAEVNSSTRLGALTRPRLLWVPVDLEDTAIQILATEHDPGSANYNVNPEAVGNERETRLANAQARVIVCPLWTDTNNWAAQADPRLYPSIGLGFRYGRTPEIYSVADPRAGLMFSNDVMPVKVRFFYAVGPIDWRGLHKSNVA